MEEVNSSSEAIKMWKIGDDVLNELILSIIFEIISLMVNNFKINVPVWGKETSTYICCVDVFMKTLYCITKYITCSALSKVCKVKVCGTWCCLIKNWEWKKSILSANSGMLRFNMS